jgi:hypothetical protein
MPAPINVCYPNPTNLPDNWDEQIKDWTELNRLVGGNPEFYPLTIKGAYVIGVIHDICQSVSRLLSAPKAREITYIPAYGVFVSGVEILGRCISGNHRFWKDNDNNIRVGFNWLRETLPTAPDKEVDGEYVLFSTCSHSFKVNELLILRHFAAHGQATLDEEKYKLEAIDYEILSKLAKLIKNGMERYWTELVTGQFYGSLLCDKLACANVIPLRGWPIDKSWAQFQGGSVSKMFSLDWTV